MQWLPSRDRRSFLGTHGHFVARVWMDDKASAWSWRLVDKRIGKAVAKSKVSGCWTGIDAKNNASRAARRLMKVKA